MTDEPTEQEIEESLCRHLPDVAASPPVGPCPRRRGHRGEHRYWRAQAVNDRGSRSVVWVYDERFEAVLHADFQGPPPALSAVAALLALMDEEIRDDWLDDTGEFDAVDEPSPDAGAEARANFGSLERRGWPDGPTSEEPTP